MTYVITDQCISCHRCLQTCPTGAIETDGTTFRINADRCNDCQGAYSVAQCRAACPTLGACVLLTDLQAVSLGTQLETATDYWSAWFETYNNRIARLQASQQQGYWQRWSHAYSQSLKNLQTQSQTGTTPPLVP
ncbi:4Fe-4S dicluster domain-containing protein [Acaryochloris sp. IP29b_bin.137]|uniref:DUF362 domain-containing protein n=1 Tax=Acaryochloris sp. IP29b_bin.137 TaxID=2969217 RepID=UPI0026348B30|nr:4Fe-4S dicluster domain-containing protein [Acaryochloris sp. IP29b_bin.137]